MGDFLFILHLLGMAMGVGTGFVMVALGASTADMSPEDRGKFMMRASAASVVSSTGVLLLVVTGVIMAIPLWSSISSLPAFHIKLGLVVILLIVFGLQQMQIAKLKREGPGPGMARVRTMGMILTALGVLIVIFAVLAFH